MNTTETVPRSPDEKMMGALAHIFGPLAAIIIWAMQKDKSRFVRFQALQAMMFDLIIALVTGLIFFCVFGAAFVGMSASMFKVVNNPSDDFGSFFLLPMIFPFMTFGCIFPFTFLLLVIRLIGAIAILNGRNFHFPILGKWLENFLNSDAT